MARGLTDPLSSTSGYQLAAALPPDVSPDVAKKVAGLIIEHVDDPAEQREMLAMLVAPTSDMKRCLKCGERFESKAIVRQRSWCNRCGGNT